MGSFYVQLPRTGNEQNICQQKGILANFWITMTVTPYRTDFPNTSEKET